jgi:hypothetical protein
MKLAWVAAFVARWAWAGWLHACACFCAGVRWMAVVFCGVFLGGICLSQLIPFATCLVLVSSLWLVRPYLASGIGQLWISPRSLVLGKLPALNAQPCHISYRRSTYHRFPSEGTVSPPREEYVGVDQGRQSLGATLSIHRLPASFCVILSRLSCFCLLIPCCSSPGRRLQQGTNS